MPERKTSAVFVIIGAMVGLVSMAIMFAFIIDAPHLLLLERQHADTMGRVIRLVPDSHGQIEIKYSVGGVTYRQTVPVYGILPPVIAGQPVPVYYYPPDPVVVFTAPPEEVFEEQRPSWVVFSMFGAFCGAIVALNSMRRSRGRIERYLSVRGPKLLSAAISIGVLGSALFSAFFGTLGVARIVGEILVLSGCAVFVNLAWRRKLTWSQLLRSRQFWIAAALVVAANIIEFQS